jgi:hypothetical protein
MKKFAKFVGKFPFAGKMSIRPLIFNLYQTTSETERRHTFLCLMGLLVVFIFFHALQARMGIQALKFESPNWAKLIFALYAIINISVVITQIYLCYRAIRFYVLAVFPQRKRGYNDYPAKESIKMVIVTLSGQFIFLSFYFLYQ